MWKYYKRTLTTGELRALVRVYGNEVEHYDGKDFWNPNWSESGQAYMDITGMGGSWYLYHTVRGEEVEEIKRTVDELYKKTRLFAYQRADDAS